MEIHRHPDKPEASKAAANRAESILIDSIDRNGEATFVIATGTSQLAFIEALTEKSTIDWSKTTMFHLDEYIGISEDHPASFRKYLRERFLDEVTPGTVHLIDGDSGDPEAECNRLNGIIREHDIDIAFVGIGENGHIAFNDPPADFETEEPFIVVDLDEACRRQQVDEGWFSSIDSVPTQAITMSVRQILAAEEIVCTVPGERKARAVAECFGDDEISPLHPSSILKEHPATHVYLDEGSSSLLNPG